MNCKEANYLFPEGLWMLDRIYKDDLSCAIASSSQYASCAFQQWGVSHYSTFSVRNQQAWQSKKVTNYCDATVVHEQTQNLQLEVLKNMFAGTTVSRGQYKAHNWQKKCSFEEKKSLSPDFKSSLKMEPGPTLHFLVHKKIAKLILASSLMNSLNLLLSLKCTVGDSQEHQHIK